MALRSPAAFSTRAVHGSSSMNSPAMSHSNINTHHHHHNNNHYAANNNNINNNPPTSRSQGVHPRARELYEHLRSFPWDVSCLTYLRCRSDIFPEVFSGKSTTTKLVEYLVELRFLTTALNGWSEVALGRSPHHLAPLDKRFVVFSIANAFHELPEVMKELMAIKDRSYSSTVKKYCDDVHAGLSGICGNPDIRALCDSVRQMQTYPAQMEM